MSDQRGLSLVEVLVGTLVGAFVLGGLLSFYVATTRSFGESDWRAPSNVLQQRFEVNRLVTPNVQLGATLYRGRTLDSTLPGALLVPGRAPALGDPWMNRFYWDVTYRYNPRRKETRAGRWTR